MTVFNFFSLFCLCINDNSPFLAHNDPLGPVWPLLLTEISNGKKTDSAEIIL